MWVMPYVMEMFTKSGNPQNQRWDLFSVKDMMLPNLLIMVTLYLHFDYSAFQQVLLLQVGIEGLQRV